MTSVSRRHALRLLTGAAAAIGTGGVVAALRNAEKSPDRTPASPTTLPTSPTTSTSTPGVPEPAPPTAEPAAEATSVAMLCREAWGAAPPTREAPGHEAARIMVHHTAVVLDDPREAPARVRGHQGFHQRNGFADLAYHFVIDGQGHVYEGRDPAKPGETFTDYDPTGWLLVTCEGNFDQQPLPDAQFESLTRVLAWASESLVTPPESIAAHRDHASTSCPGGAIHARFLDGSLVSEVRALLADGGVALERVCGETALATIRAIEAGTA